MSYLDDLVKLRYLVPMREAANSTMSNINTFQSKDIVKEFMDKIQTNPDGSGRPGGAAELDLSKPESIQKLLGMESGTLSKLFEQSGGKMDTPEAAGVMGISDRILKGMNLGSEMTAKAGTTAYQQGQTKHGEAQIEIEKEKNRLEALGMPSKMALEKAQTGYYNRMPKAGMPAEYRPKSAAEMETINDLQSAVIQSQDPLIKENQGELLDAIMTKTALPFANVKTMVAKSFPKMPEVQQNAKAKELFGAITSAVVTKQQERLKAQADIKQQTTVLALQKNWDEMLTHQPLIESVKKSIGRPITDDEAEQIARTQWMNRNLKELGINTGPTVDPLGLNIKPSVKKSLGATERY
jgi:hypothetical protein